MTCPPHMLRLEASTDGFWFVCINCHYRKREGFLPVDSIVVTRSLALTSTVDGVK
jgi:hypothetical protein